MFGINVGTDSVNKKPAYLEDIIRLVYGCVESYLCGDEACKQHKIGDNDMDLCDAVATAGPYLDLVL